MVGFRQEETGADTPGKSQAFEDRLGEYGEMLYHFTPVRGASGDLAEVSLRVGSALGHQADRELATRPDSGLENGGRQPAVRNLEALVTQWRTGVAKRPIVV